MWGNSFVAERLADSKEGLSSVLLVILHPFQLSVGHLKICWEILL
jgi:hypothetical protein